MISMEASTQSVNFVSPGGAGPVLGRSHIDHIVKMH